MKQEWAQSAFKNQSPAVCRLFTNVESYSHLQISGKLSALSPHTRLIIPVTQWAKVADTKAET